MEFLVHNISHSDLVVELSWLRDDAGNGTDAERNPCVPRSVLARPKFSLFQPISQQIMAKVEQLRAATASDQGNATQASAPMTGVETTQTGGSPELRAMKQAGLTPSLLDISEASEKNAANCGPHRRARWKVKCRDTQCPIGFNLQDDPLPVENLDQFQLRGESEATRLIETHWDRVGISAVYFPLVAVLLPKWAHVLEEFKSQSSKQIVYLISGAGIPRNAQHAVSGNSTEITAQLIALFVRQYYPHMEVVQVHSGSNIFRFDDNVQFMIRELRPRLEARRETLVAKCGDAWKAHFHVTIAYADGPPARLSALNASLRMYTPSYLHIWQLKTFWHERKLSMADVDFHAFENIEASPCVPVAKADAMTQTLVREMRVFRDQFLAAEGEGEVAGFWLRKSRKPVLAVLLVEKTDPSTGAKSLVVHRGVNCEVSMPTGSLCAERNAIGSALASDPTLRRHALKMIGVLGLNLGGAVAVAAMASSGSNGVDKGAENAQASVRAALEEIPLIPLSSAGTSSNTTSGCGGSCSGTTDPSSGDGAHSSSGSTVAIVAPITHSEERATGRTEGREAAAETLTAHPSLVIAQLPPDAAADAAALPALTVQINGASTPTANGSDSKRARHAENGNYASPRKPKRPRTFSVDESSVESLLREATAPADRNPLAPCGACKEWLVKIAEANPAFRVVTFENSRCRSVYINQLM